MADKAINLKESLKKLNEIVEWFESQQEIDVEAGLGKVKEGAELVKVCKKRLTEIENEFEQIQRDVESDEDKAPSKKSAREESSDDDKNSDDVPF